MEKVRAGSEVYLEAEVRDVLQIPPALFDPGSGVTVTVKNPSGAAVVSQGAMTKKSVGVYFYNLQTSTGDPLGAWTMEFKAVHGAGTHLSTKMGAFELVAE